MKSSPILLSLLIASTALGAEQDTQAAPTLEEAPQKLAVGTQGYLKPGLLLQLWSSVTHENDTSSAFRVRRAEVSAKGELLPDRLSYAVVFDVAASALQDALLTLSTPYAEVSLGQLKMPLTYEGQSSSSKLMFPERALSSRAYGDRRDIGLRVSKRWQYLGYTAGIFNGAGANHPEDNPSKDGALRLELYPLSDLTFAGVIAMRLWDRDEAGTRDLYGADARFVRGPLSVQAEYIRARDVGEDDLITHGQGGYAALAYKLIEVLEPCARLGYIDPNTEADDDETYSIEVGLNWYVQEHQLKLQLDYTHLQPIGGDRDPVNQLTLAAQAAF